MFRAKELEIELEIELAIGLAIELVLELFYCNFFYYKSKCFHI